jgi:hypothetical protein
VSDGSSLQNPHRGDVGADGVLSGVATLDLVQHQLSKTGHKSLVVTRALHSQ